MTCQIATLFLGLALFAGAPSPALAAPCKDARGKFVKCLPKPTPAKHAPCKDTKGKFIRCK
ncbi:hypothetical protein WG907_03765 [Sphingobium sp. AN558]|uniref:hypothetical protein n=1 Tax=Sphingobium sp. AN558 TaxID=3133442 RepID=UPI0030BEA4DF